MADYHTSYQRAEGESTQWEDLQRKFGNLPAKAPAEKPAAFAPAEEQRRDAAWVDGHAEDELEALDEELGDDRFLEAYRSAPLCSVAVTAVLGRVTSPRAWRAPAQAEEAGRAAACARADTVWLGAEDHADRLCAGGLRGQRRLLGGRPPVQGWVRRVLSTWQGRPLCAPALCS